MSEANPDPEPGPTPERDPTRRTTAESATPELGAASAPEARSDGESSAQPASDRLTRYDDPTERLRRLKEEQAARRSAARRESPVAPLPTPTSAPTEEPGRVRRSIPCFKCGYLLTGLKRQDVCPECGTPVEATFWMSMQMGGPKDEYSRAVRRGVIILLTVVFGLAILALLGWLMTR